ncbi:MAG: Maf family nucleotide pyrophosphatase [Gammaproteobacteria bacterium]|nr:Maf family nucleotide pyrophosphatase [Gammaproteobacteria bacterium]
MKSSNTTAKIILASSSPFRKALLQRLQLDFDTISPNIDEIAQNGELPEKLVARLSLMKAREVAKSHPDALIIGSDQVALLDGKIVGKPGNHRRATAQLFAASGKKVTFLTGLSLLNSQNAAHETVVVPFDVEFRQLNAVMIEAYLQHEQPYQCAGSFKSEGLGIALFKRLNGDDPSALIGLPLIQLTRMLEKAGIVIL